jgi:7-carboxy-7-deazaguanine synthase
MTVTGSAPGTLVGAQAPVLEVFASIQGEGRYVGQPQAFVRLRGCPLRCRWCDTPGSLTLEEGARARIGHGGGARRTAAWASPFQVATWVLEVEDGAPRTISVTGGEPLLWPGFVRALRRYVGPRRVHLETAGAHPEALESVLDAVDHVSLDLKLPGDLETPVELDGELREPAPRNSEEWASVRVRVLRLVQGRDACAKVPVAGGHAPEDFAALMDDLAQHAPDVPCVLQPVTPVAGVPAPDRALLDALIEAGLERRLDVRLVPQVHRFLGVP